MGGSTSSSVYSDGTLGRPGYSLPQFSSAASQGYSSPPENPYSPNPTRYVTPLPIYLSSVTDRGFCHSPIHTNAYVQCNFLSVKRYTYFSLPGWLVKNVKIQNSLNSLMSEQYVCYISTVSNMFEDVINIPFLFVSSSLAGMLGPGSSALDGLPPPPQPSQSLLGSLGPPSTSSQYRSVKLQVNSTKKL